MKPSDYLPDPKTGLHLPASDRPNLRVGIENWITVQRIENMSGKISGSWRFPNLLLNRGLDEHFISDLFDLVKYGAASEDATAPVVTDIALGSEVLRSSATGGITQVFTEVAAGHFKLVDTRQLASNGNYNIRKVGFSEDSTPDGTVNVAEQIKDSGGNPDVVTLNATQSLRMSSERHYYFSPLVATAGMVQVAGFPGQNPDPDNRTGKYSFAKASNTQPLGLWSEYARGSNASNSHPSLGASSGALQLGWNVTDSLDGADLNIAYDSYTPGDYYRTASITLGVTDHNHAHRSYEVAPRFFFEGGLYRWVFDAGQEPTKDDLGKVTLKLPRITLARRP